MTLPQRQAAAISPSTFSTSSSCVFGDAFGITWRDGALLVDDERRPQRAPVGAAVHRLLRPDAVGLADGVVLVGQQAEVERLLVGELLDRLDGIRATRPGPPRPPPRSRRGGRGSRRPASCSRACRPWDRSRGRQGCRGSRRAGRDSHPGPAARSRERSRLARSSSMMRTALSSAAWPAPGASHRSA